MRAVTFDVEAFEKARLESGLSLEEIATRADLTIRSLYRIKQKRRGDLKSIRDVWQVVTDRKRRVPIVDLDEPRRVVGEIRKNQVHRLNLPHRSTIVVVRCGPSEIVCCWRHPTQRAGGRIDCFGEHERIEDEECPEQTAKRVLKDEIRIGVGMSTSPIEDFVDGHSFRQVGADYCLRPYVADDGAADPENKYEWSSLFVLDTRETDPEVHPASIRAFDEPDTGGEKALRIQRYKVESLLRLDPKMIADGLAKVLRETREKSPLGVEIISLLKSGLR